LARSYRLIFDGDQRRLRATVSPLTPFASRSDRNSAASRRRRTVGLPSSTNGYASFRLWTDKWYRS
jgi:hypothetical protein